MRFTPTLAIAAALLAGAAVAEPRDFTDPAGGYTMKIPEGWSDVTNGQTLSADGAVQCTMTAQAVARTAAMTQDQVNTAMQAYTAEVWRTQFFTGGVSGSIDKSGITKMEQYDAPWARGRMAYPTGQEVTFGALVIARPGRLASVTCLSAFGAYETNLAGISTVLNWLRPL